MAPRLTVTVAAVGVVSLGILVQLLEADAAPTAAPLPRITASATSPYLFDADGRVRLFHGVNAVHKAAPWFPGWLLNETLVADMASWGVNVVRVGWLFNGLMPQPSYVNESYFNAQRAVVQMLASHGIHTLLDAHQDVLSSRFCLYDAWPLWVIDRSVAQHPFPWPLKGNCSSRPWGANELTEAAATCYQDIYNNTAGMRDMFATFWSESAARWAGDTNVIGMELMNEPFAGDVYADPLLFLPGVAGSTNLQPFYDVLADAIRKHDDDVLLFYEPVVWGMLLDSTTLGSGFTHVPGGAAYANRSVYSYHYYCSSFGGDPSVCNELIDPLIMTAVRDDVKGLGGSSFMTEWGGCDGTEASTLDECLAVAASADRNFQSWTEYSGFGQSGVYPDAVELRVLTRAYMRAIAGTPVNMTFNDTTLAFDACWEVDTSIAAPSVAFVPFARRYGGVGGASVTGTLNLKLAVDAAAQQVSATWVPGAGMSGAVLQPTRSKPGSEVACLAVRRL